MVTRARYEELYPKSQAITLIPPVRGTRNVEERLRAPAYAAGWTMKFKEVRNKWDPNGKWGTILEVEHVLTDKWFDKNLKANRDPLIGFPYPTVIDGYNILFPVTTNHSKKNMTDFVERRQEIFHQLCKLFDNTDEEEITKMEKRFKWYRYLFFSSNSFVEDHTDQYPDSEN